MYADNYIYISKRNDSCVIFVMCGGNLPSNAAFHCMKNKEATIIQEENHFSAIDHLLCRNIASIVKEHPVSDHSAIYIRPTFLPQSFLSAGLSEHV